MAKGTRKNVGKTHSSPENAESRSKNALFQLSPKSRQVAQRVVNRPFFLAASLGRDEAVIRSRLLVEGKLLDALASYLDVAVRHGARCREEALPFGRSDLRLAYVGTKKFFLFLLVFLFFRADVFKNTLRRT